MERIFKFGRALFLVGCLCFIFNVGDLQGQLVRACQGEIAGDECVTRPGGNYICDCVGPSCGKTCTRQISTNCAGGTCKAASELEIQ